MAIGNASVMPKQFYFSGLIRSQTNTDEHDPEECKDKYNDWENDDDDCPVPIFKPGVPKVSRPIVYVIYTLTCNRQG